MRTLIITRGLPGSGKSTFIKKAHLEQYAISSDALIPMLSSPVYGADGQWGIDKEILQKSWAIVNQMLEIRMKRGEFTIVDGTHVKGSDLTKYRKLADKYRYKLFLLDFTSVDVETCKIRNQQRTGINRVPESVIESMNAELIKEPTNKIKKGFTVIDVVDSKYMMCEGKKYYNLMDCCSNTIDISEYDKVHIIGDIHGCYSALTNWLSSQGGYKENELYVFLGDYFDKGIENVEMFNFITNFSKNPNVICIEGNHEKHLWKWANNEACGRCRFTEVTAKEFEAAGISKKEARKFYRSLWQMGNFEFHHNRLICTHGGCAEIPNLKTSTKFLIYGTGTYQESHLADDTFEANSQNISCGKNKFYSFHGHRNVTGEPIRVNEHAFNLEGQIELGGCLRTVTISYNEELDCLNFKTMETPNDVFEIQSELIDVIPNNVENVVTIMRACEKYIKERKFKDISSFNFSRNTFNKAIWNNLTIKARGLFINTKTNEIVLRSYDKFFRINETEETQMDNLKKNLVFPLTVYKKENGFLGLLGWDKEKDDFIFATKGSLEGPYVNYFKTLFFKQFEQTPDQLENLKNYFRYCDKNKTFVFEVIDIENDPHIIKYDKSKIVLLDVIFNEISFKQENYSRLKDYRDRFGFEIKQKCQQFNTWEEFSNWYLSESGNYNNHIEGYVLQDSNNFHFKVKTQYYNFWKQCRNIAESVQRYGAYNGISSLKWNNDYLDNTVVDFHNFLKEKKHKNQLEGVDIITLREEFLDN